MAPMKHRRLSIGLLLAALSWSGTAGAAPAAPIYVIPIKGQIERALVYAVRRGVQAAERAQAPAIILDMDTPGGRLDATEEIIDILTSARATTYTFVNPNAFSAGAIIAMATDHIYMAPAGRIGDAMPIIMSPLPFGSPQEIPAGLREKMMSPTVALIRSAAQRKGHDVELAEAMVRPEKGYRAGDWVVCPTGQLATLTSQDAAQQVGEPKRPLLSEGTVKDIPELLARIGFPAAPVTRVQTRAAERIARVIDSFPFSGLLLGLGLLALYIEIKTPGFGFPGIAGIVLLAVWFWGHNIAGLAGMTEVLLFVLGAALLAVEIFVIPGFGAAGVGGLAMMVAALIMAMVEHAPGEPWYRLSDWDLQSAIYNLGTALILLAGLGVILVRFLPQTPMFKRLTLSTTVSRGEGYRAASPSASLIGLRGTAITPLRPAGIAVFGNQRMDVVTRGDFLPPNCPIVIAETDGNRIIVEERSETAAC
jgi:membrane-bound serine protease (ClpP class)